MSDFNPLISFLVRIIREVSIISLIIYNHLSTVYIFISNDLIEVVVNNEINDKIR
jgi:hypothetical protein